MRFRVALAALAAAVGMAVAPVATASADTAFSFKTHCSYLFSKQMDPMTQPGVVPSAHMHDFFGSTQVNSTSTGPQLKSASVPNHTSCALGTDTASYWSPSLYENAGPNATQVLPDDLVAYYVAVPGMLEYDKTTHMGTVTDPPTGLNVLGGNKNATSAQSHAIVTWRCANINYPTWDPGADSYPPDCSEVGSGGLTMNVVLPDCWTGVTRAGFPTSSGVDNLKNKQTITGTGTFCPQGYNVQIPEVRAGVHYRNLTLQPDCRATSAAGGTHGCTYYSLSTNPADMNSIYQVHINEMYGWQMDNPINPASGFGLNSLDDRCLNHGTTAGCGDLSTNPTGDAFK